MLDAPPDPYEPYLHRTLLRATRQLAHGEATDPGAGAALAQRVFTLLVTTPVPALAASTGAVLLVLLGTDLQDFLIEQIQQIVQAGPGGRALAVLAGDPAVRAA